MLSIPVLSSADVSRALTNAGISLSLSKREALKKRLALALHNYVVSKVHGELIGAIKPSERARRLARVGNVARRLYNELAGTTSKSRDTLQQLRRHLLAQNGDADLAAQLLPTLKTLELVAAQAEKRSARRVKANSATRNRHNADAAMLQFFGEVNGAWMDVFHKVPGVTFNATSYGGAYIPFVRSILHSFANMIPDELENAAPGLRKALRLTDAAIHSRFRETGISGINPIAARLVESINKNS